MDKFTFFQQKPLMTTRDGYQIFPNESFVSVNKYKMVNGSKTIEALTIVERLPIANTFAHKFEQDDTLIYFKHRKNAEKYVKVFKKYLN